MIMIMTDTERYSAKLELVGNTIKRLADDLWTIIRRGLVGEICPRVYVAKSCRIALLIIIVLYSIIIHIYTIMRKLPRSSILDTLVKY